MAQMVDAGYVTAIRSPAVTSFRVEGLLVGRMGLLLMSGESGDNTIWHDRLDTEAGWVRSQMIRARLRVARVLTAVVLLATACSGSPSVPDGFRLVGEEKVGLNGVENKGRPPLQFLLIASATDEGSATEAQLVDRYVEKLEAEGWDVDAWSDSNDWWTSQGNDGVAFVRVGPASRFHELATISEGYSRTRFRDLAGRNPEPLIVVSIDKAG